MKKVLFTSVVLIVVAAGAWYYVVVHHQVAQKQTVSDIRNIGNAWLSWLTDQVSEGPAGPLLEDMATTSDLKQGAPVHPFQRTNLLLSNPVPQSVKTYDASKLKQITYADLKIKLVPGETFFYIQEIPEKDGWGNPYEFYLNDNLLLSNVLLIRSPGRDGKFSDSTTSPYTVKPFDATSYDEDIVWADGYWVRWPQEKVGQ